MIPLKADVPSGSVPFVTMGLIAPNVLLFLATIFTSMFLRRGLFHVAGTILYPYASVLILVIFGFFVRIVRWPAMIVLGLWIVIQFINGLITARASAVGGEATGARRGSRTSGGPGGDHSCCF
jgi:hypothetical protein